VVDGVEHQHTIPTYTYVGGEFLERRAKNQLRLKAVNALFELRSTRCFGHRAYIG